MNRFNITITAKELSEAALSIGDRGIAIVLPDVTFTVVGDGWAPSDALVDLANRIAVERNRRQVAS